MIRFLMLGALLLSVAAALHAPPALAQGLTMGGPGGGAAGGGGGGDDDKKKPAPPSAIPGAVAGTVAPATRSANDMDPNAALFDAIDRGDITAARDALARGADLNARNVLGQRPVDLSIDLSRNDITFLLLSMRSQNGDQAPAESGGDVADAGAPAAAAAPASASLSGRPGADEFASTRNAGSGTAAPSAGFLGFGGH